MQGNGFTPSFIADCLQSGANFSELCGKRVIVDLEDMLEVRPTPLCASAPARPKPQNYCSTCRVKTKYRIQTMQGSAIS